MAEPKQGYNQHNKDNNNWSFILGLNKTNDPIELRNFLTLVDLLITNKKLFKDFMQTNIVINAWQVQATSNILSNYIGVRKVSTKDLIDKEAPKPLLHHHKIHPLDKATWDLSYQ